MIGGAQCKIKMRQGQGRVVDLLFSRVPFPNASWTGATPKGVQPPCKDVPGAGIGGGWEAPLNWP